MDLNQNSQMNFKGISNPYINKAGYKVIPIAQNPEQKDIDEAIFATQNSKAHCGLNGRAYFLGEDLVVKKYLPENEAISYNPQREINALDKIFEKNVRNKGIQEGKYAFTTPDNEVYLVSSKINGETPDKITNKFNKENLKKVIETIQTLDKPTRKAELTELNFPFEIPMHYDLNGKNIIISENDGGLIDFEYSNFEDLEDGWQKEELGIDNGTNVNAGDIPGTISNLRGFEHLVFINYLNQLPQNEAKELFRDYLKIKSQYHEALADKYTQENENSNGLNKPTAKIARKYRTHAKVLEEYNPDIAKAEAIKIQIADFIYRQSPFSKEFSEADKINPSQIKGYLHQAKQFFKEKIKEAIKNNDKDKKEYFKDCLKTVQNWEGLDSWMDWQFQEPNRENFRNDSDYQKFKEDHELFLSKLSNRYIKTLDEKVCD